ncbi:MAG: SAM-dependent methyltransferase [Tannerellaceae bacterium]|jgi:hypothetical protein|nr:SAM-dependent methyltransferase [Tannerellaceae bacterium]
MKKNELIAASETVACKLRAIDYENLPISDYNKQYIRKIYPALRYYLDIFVDCLYKGIQSTGLAASGITLIDYGGGSGFLSILAKEAGIGQVIYIDLNPLSVDTIRVLKETLGIGPDIILSGNSDVLAGWCKIQQLKPQLLIATDLIEHVYDLKRFFADLCTINDGMQLFFTTASTPYNPLVKRKLRRFMKKCETGIAVSPNYYEKRREFIKGQYPTLSEEQINVWGSCTRGLIYEDIRKAIDTNHLPFPEDKYNTCDPETGNWAERILPMKYYKELLDLYGYQLYIRKGFYNIHRSNLSASFLFRFLNGCIRHLGKAGLFISPFIILRCKR